MHVPAALLPVEVGLAAEHVSTCTSLPASVLMNLLTWSASVASGEYGYLAQHGPQASCNLPVQGNRGPVPVLMSCAGSCFQTRGPACGMRAVVGSRFKQIPGLQVDVHTNLGDLWRAQGATGQAEAQRCYA